jgi:two-component system nitrogen regulation sensor histidine kinase NtrY
MKALFIRILTRVLLLLATLMTLSWGLERWVLVYSLCLGVLALLQVTELLRFLTRSNRELASFLLSVRYHDFSRHFNEKDPGQGLLRAAFNELNRTYKQLSFEKEAQYHYLRNLLELVNTGILSYDDKGEIKWMNDSLKKMLGIPYLKSIHSLLYRDTSLYQVLRSLSPGENRLIEIAGREPKKVLLSASQFKLEEGLFVIVAFQNINQALEETETQAWQKLLRVLNHEIMNSIAPIASLADTLRRRMEATENDPELISDLQSGIEVIQNRSENLLRFAETYRHLSKLSEPTLAEVSVIQLFENIEILLEQQLETQGIELDVSIRPAELSLRADASLVEQVLLNLVLNAIEAVNQQSEAIIRLSGYLSDVHRPVIEVADNGQGIPAEVLDKIFIPFFTTKKTGSGIGLSLSKQIMQLHKGNLTVKSQEGQGSIFRMVF